VYNFEPIFVSELANWIGHIWRRNCLLKHVIDGTIEGRTEVTGSKGGRRKQLLKDLKENTRYCIFKKEARAPLCGELALQDAMNGMNEQMYPAEITRC